MADIKLTLRADPKKRSPSVESEAQWLQDEGRLYYQLQAQPLKAKPGCRVYFIRDGRLAARARANAFQYKEADELGGTYTGASGLRPGWYVEVIRPMEIA